MGNIEVKIEEYRSKLDELLDRLVANQITPEVYKLASEAYRARIAELEGALAGAAGHTLPEDAKAPRGPRRLIPAVLIAILTISALTSSMWYVATVRLSNAEGEIQRMSKELERLEDRARKAESDLLSYKANRPTLEQLRAFLAVDPISERKYESGSYVCINFANDLRLAAKRAGWNISFVFVNYEHGGKGYGHACNGALLANGTHVYIEPQSDRIYINLEDLLRDLLKGQSPWITTVVEIW
jgi:hypothetical protein